MKDKTTNEINLVDILVMIGNGIAWTVKRTILLVGNMLKLIFRNKIMTICFLVIGILVGQYFARPSNRKYHADAMAALYGVKAHTVIELGKQLSKSSSRFEVTSIGHKLGLPDSIAQKLVGVRFLKVIDYKRDSIPDMVDFSGRHSLSDTMNIVMSNYVYIRLVMLGTDHVDVVGDAVVNFINNNPVVRAGYESVIKSLVQEIAIVEAEKDRIDSLAKIKYFEQDKPNIKFNNDQLLIGNQITQLFYNDILNLQEKKSRTDFRLEQAKSPLVLPSGFIIDPIAINGRMENIAKGFLAGLLLSIVCAFVVENIRKWLAFLNDK